MHTAQHTPADPRCNGAECRCNAPERPRGLSGHPKAPLRAATGLLRGLVSAFALRFLPVATNEATPNPHRDALAQLLGLPATTADDALTTAANTAVAGLANAEQERTAANTRRVAAIAALGLAAEATNEQIHAAILAVPAVRTRAETAENEARTLRTDLARALLDGAITEGRITAAERLVFETAFNTDFTGTRTRLANEKKKLGTGTALLNGVASTAGKGVGLQTENRIAALNAAVNARMKADGTDYDTAYAAVLADPAHAQLVQSMQPQAA